MTKKKNYKVVPFLSKKEIEVICKDLGEQINSDYSHYVTSKIEQNDDPRIIALCILKGGLFFVADILRNTNIPFVIDFVKLSSYGKDTRSSGTVTILQDISTDVRGKDIIIFDEIVDSGRTLSFYIERLKAAEPRSIRVCTLIDKKACRSPEVDVTADYVGLDAGEEFLIGYGLDYGERYRNLPDIYQLIEQ